MAIGTWKKTKTSESRRAGCRQQASVKASTGRVLIVKSDVKSDPTVRVNPLPNLNREGKHVERSIGQAKTITLGQASFSDLGRTLRCNKISAGGSLRHV